MQRVQTLENRGSLVLTRNLNQKIRIGRDVVVQVIDIKGDRVKLRVEAPRSVVVHREEVFDRVQGEQ